MAEKSTPVVAGVGGVALLATVMSLGGGHSSSPDALHTSKPAGNAATSAHFELTSDQNGPWYAFCQEYATNEFDHGEDPSHERGIQGHQVPKEAEEGTVEITRQIRSPSGPETEKFNVRKHMVGDLTGCVANGTRLRIVIALVPDPNATLMPLEFDRDIEAIQAAAGAGRYNYTRFWFPWRTGDAAQEKTAEPETEVHRREEPGILCFRKSSSAPGAPEERLFVLLVGETPTSGANRLQLAHALFYQQQLRAANELSADDQDQVLISGPHFSASFKPIQDVVTAQIYKNREAALPFKTGGRTSLPAVRLASPDASGARPIEDFRKFCSQQQPRCTLATLSLTSTEVEQTALAYLQFLGYSKVRIAQLNEDESTFGTLQRNEVKDDSDFRSGGFGLTLSFPRDLSSLRSLSDAESARIAESASKYFSQSSSSALELAAAEPIDRDSPAAFGTQQEAAQNARALADTVREMRVHRIQAVMVNASNPLDRIYLLQYLHEVLPDVRTVTTDADELELDRPHFVDLTGTIAVTTLPTLGGMENLIGPDKAGLPVSFRSSRQEGEYLAVERLLRPPQESGSKPNDCHSISIVGEDGFQLIPFGQASGNLEQPTFPCFVQTNVSVGAERGKLDPSFAPEAYLKVNEHTNAPGPFLAFLAVLALFNALHFRCLYGSYRRKSGMLSYPGALDSRPENTRLYLLLVVNNQLLLLNTFAARVAHLALMSILRQPAYDRALIFLYTIILLALVATLGVSLQLLSMFAGRAFRSKEPSREKAFETVIALIFLGTSAWMLLTLPALKYGRGIFVERLTQLSGGLSPIIPVSAILLGYFLWGWMQLRRLDSAASSNADLTVPTLVDREFAARIEAIQSRLDTLEPPPAVSLASLLVLTATAVVLKNSLNGFDGKWFRLWFLAWGVVMLLLTATNSCFQAWSIWKGLKRLLDWLETTDLKDAFQKVGSNGLLRVSLSDLGENERSSAILRSTVQSMVRIASTATFSMKHEDEESEASLQPLKKQTFSSVERVDSLDHALNVWINDAVRTISGGGGPGPDEELKRYLALRLVSLIRYAMLQIRALIGYVAYSYVLAVVSVTFYPFQGRKTTSGLLMLTFAGLLVSIAMMTVQYQRNGMLGRLEGEAPGEVSYWQVAGHLLTVGGLPLLAILGSQFPAIANFVMSIFGPILGAIH